MTGQAATPSRRPVRVLQVLTSDAVAGIELLIASLSERLHGTSMRITVAMLAPPGPIAERLRSGGIKTHSLGGSGLAVAAIRLASLLRTGNFDVVNAHGFKSTMLVRVLARALAPRTAVVCSVHGLHVTEVEDVSGAKARAVLALDRVSSSLVDLYDVNTQGGVRFLTSSGFDAKRLRYTPNAIDVRSWPLTAASRSAEGAPLILCVARFVKRKRQETLIRALELLRRQRIEFRAILAGAGPTLAENRALVESLGLSSAVELPGAVTPAEVKRLMREADVFCLPSLWEGTVLCILEAMASGVPVVGTAVNGIDELVVDGRTGFLVPPEQPAALAESISKILADPQLGQTFALAGRRRVEELFDLDAAAAARKELYLNVLTRA